MLCYLMFYVLMFYVLIFYVLMSYVVVFCVLMFFDPMFYVVLCSNVLCSNVVMFYVLVLYILQFYCSIVLYSKAPSWPTVFARPRITHFERKNSRPDIPILTAYEITPTTILKHVFHETTHEEVYIRIIIPKVNA